MAEEQAQDVNPATNPEVPQPVDNTVPASQVDRSPAEVNPSSNPQVPDSVQIAGEIPRERLEELDARVDATVASINAQAAAERGDDVGQADLNGSTALTTESENFDPYIRKIEAQKTVEQITASQPDAAFQRAQQAKEERWQTAAATNPDGINNNGSVSVDLGDGQREIINRDGSFSIAGPQGEYRYNADGQLESYTTPTIGGLSQTYTTDGVVVETYSAGPLRTETISYNGELVSTNTTVQTGDTTLQQIQVGEGPPVNAAIITVRGEGTAGLQITAAQQGDGEIVTSTLDLEQRRLDLLAADEARAEAAEQLAQDIKASQAQIESGIPLSATQLAAIEEQVREVEDADRALFEAEQAVAEIDTLLVSNTQDPQLGEFVDQDTIPSLATTDFSPTNVLPIESGYPEIEPEIVPASSFEVSPELLDAVESGYPQEPDVFEGTFTDTADEINAFESGYPQEPDVFEGTFTDTADEINAFESGYPEAIEGNDAAFEAGFPQQVDAIEAGYPDETISVFESEYPAPEEVNVFESGYPDPDAQTADERAYDEQLNSDLQQWAQTSAARDKAQLQQTIAEQRKTPNNGDWRVKLRLAPQADYLYAASDPGPLLQPLKITNGIIFPYTPQIETQYKANYSSYDLTHSNYRGYFYQNSYVDAVNLRCTFTAQSTSEANYLLAVIHFFRSVTKMFYGQDAQRGSPPPLVYLTGLGQYQFNEHPCLVSAFNYNLPNDVDYIRAQSPNINNTNLSQRRAKQSTIGGGLLGPLLGGAINRLANAGAPKGGITAPPPPPNLGLNNPTYVPTKMEINVTMLPVQSRGQISKQFSVKQFANGDLLKGGFW